jgi:TolA-binding protein
MKSGNGGRPCAEAERLGRASTAGLDADLAEHLRWCRTCRAEWSELSRLSALGAALPAPASGAARRELVRARVVAAAGAVHGAARAAATTGAGRRRLAAGGAGAAAVAAALLLARAPHTDTGALRAERTAHGPPAAPAHRGTIRASGHVQYFWSALPDEVVRLSEGEVTIDVAPLGARERFRVVTGDAEVEVHGTSFFVRVAADRLLGVGVTHGLVDVRPAGGVPVLLGATQQWHAAAPATVAVAAAVAPAPAAAPREPRLHERPATHAHAEGPRGAGAAASAAERAFADGWSDLRAGRYADAAGAFARVTASGRHEALAEDALYWRAVALARAGHATEARAAMTSFIDGHRTSHRTGEMSAMLGWLLVDVHDDERAALMFEAAARDHAPAVRASAEAGLAAIARRARRPSP